MYKYVRYLQFVTQHIFNLILEYFHTFNIFSEHILVHFTVVNNNNEINCYSYKHAFVSGRVF